MKRRRPEVEPLAPRVGRKGDVDVEGDGVEGLVGGAAGRGVAAFAHAIGGDVARDVPAEHVGDCGVGARREGERAHDH